MKEFGIKFVYVFVFCLIAEQVNAKIFERCELARYLRSRGLPFDQLGTWVCIAHFESNYNTAAVNRNSGDHGIFQISQIYWCSPPGTGCGVTCAAMEDNNIDDDIMCVKRIFNEHQRLQGNGFKAWTTYNDRCHDKILALAHINGCF